LLKNKLPAIMKKMIVLIRIRFQRIIWVR
jgi:hypothetical protein